MEHEVGVVRGTRGWNRKEEGEVVVRGSQEGEGEGRGGKREGREGRVREDGWFSSGHVCVSLSHVSLCRCLCVAMPDSLSRIYDDFGIIYMWWTSLRVCVCVSVSV